MKKLIATAAVVAALLTGCASTEDPNATTTTTGTTVPEMSVGQAFCADLESGLTAIQILGPFVREGTYGSAEDTAYMADSWARNDCPEQRETNESLRAFLQAWNVIPKEDA